MGPDQQTRNDAEADAFFARFNDAPAEVIAAVVAEQGGNLAEVVQEDLQFGYWARLSAERAARRTARERTAAAARIATARRTAHPDETARLSPLPPESLALLPAPRLVHVTDAERRAAARWFRLAGRKDEGRVLANRLQYESRVGPERARKAHRAWQIEQRLFEHEQWQQVLDHMYRTRHRAAARWTAISEQRALEIAIAALDHSTPPQGRK